LRFLESVRVNPALNDRSDREHICWCGGKSGVQFLSIPFQRNRFVAAATEKSCNVLRCECCQSQFVILNDMDQFMEEQSVREWLMRDHGVHIGDRGHVLKIWQQTWREPHSYEFGVKRRIVDSPSRK